MQQKPAFISRPLSEREIGRCREAGERAFARLNRQTVPEQGGARALVAEFRPDYVLSQAISPFAHHLMTNLPNISSEDHQVVVPIGRVKIGSNLTGMVLKFGAVQEGSKAFGGQDRFTLHWNFLKYACQEVTASWLREIGFPVVAHHAVGEILPDLPAVVSQNLASGGCKLSEAYGFDFGLLKNGPELSRQLSEYVSRLAELRGAKRLEICSHLSDDEPNLAFTKTFFVRYWPIERVGVLVMADLDHTKYYGLYAMPLQFVGGGEASRLTRQLNALNDEYEAALKGNGHSQRFRRSRVELENVITG